MHNLKSTLPNRLLAATAGLLFATSALAQTITWQENWELPSAQDDWIADFGYWEIGVPTYGPPDRGDSWLAHQDKGRGDGLEWGLHRRPAEPVDQFAASGTVVQQ